MTQIKWGELVSERGYIMPVIGFALGALLGGFIGHKLGSSDNLMFGDALFCSVIGFILGHMLDPTRIIIYQEVRQSNSIRHYSKSQVALLTTCQHRNSP